MKRFSVLSFLGGYAAALLALALIAAPVFAGSAVTPEDLRCEYISAPIGVDVAQPRLSWRLAGDGAQSAYRVKVALEDNFTDASIVWDSGWVESADSAQIVYSGKPLDSDTDYFWSVQVKDAAGEVSDTVCSTWTSGLAQEDWTAQWIWDGHAFAATPEDGNNPPDPFFRKSFDLKSAPNRAIFFLASFGYHELYVNGQKVTENVLAPNVSDLGHRVCYVAYDIKDYLRAGKNTVAVWLGSGWSIYANYRRDDRPNAPAFMAQCDIRTDDGSYLLVSDDSWKSAPSEIQLLGVWFFGQYGGEFIDTNKAVPDWNKPEFDDSAWGGVETFTPSVAVSGQFGEQNRCQEWFHAVGIEEKQPG
ncbi:MAG: alpha-L-rhamnosidase N-terminal domain-containing protein, partial [Thermoguttaceae bacterium]|nr:alpha-L-rhamnosidase N-terminal domain-containing protein [Thermoguttaceae bacterium]